MFRKDPIVVVYASNRKRDVLQSPGTSSDYHNPIKEGNFKGAKDLTTLSKANSSTNGLLASALNYSNSFLIKLYNVGHLFMNLSPPAKLESTTITITKFQRF